VDLETPASPLGIYPISVVLPGGLLHVLQHLCLHGDLRREIWAHPSHCSQLQDPGIGNPISIRVHSYRLQEVRRSTTSRAAWLHRKGSVVPTGYRWKGTWCNQPQVPWRHVGAEWEAMGSSYPWKGLNVVFAEKAILPLCAPQWRLKVYLSDVLPETGVAVISFFGIVFVLDCCIMKC
jgi:hypothetical protein